MGQKPNSLFKVSVFKEDDEYFDGVMSAASYLYDNYSDFCEFPITVECLSNNKKLATRFSGMTKREISRTLNNLTQ